MKQFIGAFVFAYGLLLVLGGLLLAGQGGTLAFLLMGFGNLASGLMLLRGDTQAFGGYALVLTASLVWALLDCGADPVQLAPRVGVALLLGLGVALSGLFSLVTGKGR